MNFEISAIIAIYVLADNIYDIQKENIRRTAALEADG